MIKRLRRRFIFIAMVSVLAVLGTVIFIINLLNYQRTDNYSNRIMTLLIENGGKFPSEIPDDDDNKSGFTTETPYENRYFTVELDSEGNVLNVNTEFIAEISEEVAEDYAVRLFHEGRENGMYWDYKYSVIEDSDGVTYVFLDCSKNLFLFRNFLMVSLLISAIGLGVTFILVFIFSKIITRPFEENYARQKQFITNASHDIKTPLTVIGANTDVLEIENGANEWTDEIKKQIARLSALTDQLVFLTKTNEDNFKLQQSEFSLSELVFEITQIYRSVALEKGYSFNFEIEDGIEYKGNEDSLRRTLALIFDNAVKYTNEGGYIFVELTSTARRIQLNFSNSAKGIKKGRHDEFFERFYRGERAGASNVSGNGVGLSVAKSVVEAHKGKISAFSEDGRSLQISITL